MRYTWMLSVSLLAVTASATLAHGPQMQITAADEKIITREVLTDDYFPLIDPKSVYVMPVMEYEGVWYTRPETELNPSDHPVSPGGPTYYSGPGLAYGLGATFDSGEAFSLWFNDELKLWDGAQFSSAGDARLEAFRGEVTALSPTTEAPSLVELPFSEIASAYNEQAHSTARFRFLGDGATTAAPGDGVYLGSFHLSSTQEGLADSDPFYFVMHKNAAWADVMSAVDSLGVAPSQVQVLGVPEPSSVALVGLAAIAGLWRLQRRA